MRRIASILAATAILAAAATTAHAAPAKPDINHITRNVVRVHPPTPHPGHAHDCMRTRHIRKSELLVRDIGQRYGRDWPIGVETRFQSAMRVKVCWNYDKPRLMSYQIRGLDIYANTLDHLAWSCMIFDSLHMGLIAEDRNGNMIIESLADIPCAEGKKHLEAHYHFVHKHALPRLWLAHGHTPIYYVGFIVGLRGLKDQEFVHKGHLG